MKRLALVDTNNIGFMSMNDHNPVLSFLSRISEYKAKFPTAHFIYLNDGRSWRRDIYPEYKANRTVSEKQNQAREDYFEKKQVMLQFLEALGCKQVSAVNMEADDWAAILSKKWDGNTILISRDKDWNQLVDDRTVQYCPYNKDFLRHNNFERVTRYKSTSQFVEAKSILGDAGDNIKGLKGVGPAALEGVYASYPSFEEFLRLMDTDRETQIDLWKNAKGKIMPKVLREIDTSEARDKLAFNRSLVDLHTDARPEPKNIVRNNPVLDRDKFLDLCYSNGFSRLIRDAENFLSTFK